MWPADVISSLPSKIQTKNCPLSLDIQLEVKTEELFLAN